MEHPIESLMQTVMTSLRDMIDVNTIIGDAVETSDNTLIIPVSKVTIGYAAGGSEFGQNQPRKSSNNNGEMASESKLPFGGGSGAGVSLNPVAFLVVKDGMTKLLTINPNNPWDKLIDLTPEIANKLLELLQNMINKSKEE